MWSTILTLDATTGSTGSPSSTRDRVDHVDRRRIGDRDHARGPSPSRPSGRTRRWRAKLIGSLLDQLDRDVLGARQVAQVRHLRLQRERERELVLVDQPAAGRAPRRAARPPRAAWSSARSIVVRRDATPRDQDLAEQRRDRADRRPPAADQAAPGHEPGAAIRAPSWRGGLAVGLGLRRRRRRRLVRLVDARRRVLERALEHLLALAHRARASRGPARPTAPRG